ncbi:hypothetical protein GCM10025858_32250 [Alicyclobacillus sacchari]|nr:hypothetical protein GCM10025858_32250 [Alicyclobacillus sacchari]
MEKPVVGFLGLGKMGLPMSLNLVRGGYEVHGYDVVPRSREAFASEGARLVSPSSTWCARRTCCARACRVLPR